MLQKFLVAQFDVFVPRLNPVLVRDVSKVTDKFIGSMICHLWISQKCSGNRR